MSLIGKLPEAEQSNIAYRRRVEAQALEVARAHENLAKMGAVPAWVARSKRAEARREGRERRQTEERALKTHGLYKAPSAKPTVTAIPGTNGTGLRYNVTLGFSRRGQIGIASSGGFYVVEDGRITSEGHRTLAPAVKAFAKGAQDLPVHWRSDRGDEGECGLVTFIRDNRESLSATDLAALRRADRGDTVTVMGGGARVRFLPVEALR